MLWQPSLPERYTKAAPSELAADITVRRKQLGSSVVILGHHYQTDDIIQHADHTGDSLKLSQIAAQLCEKNAATRTIIFCGVHFMAESADMLTPEGVDVVLPDLSAGCSMADMAQYEDTVDAWDAIHDALKAQGWRGRVVPITYVNSSAAIKAFVGAHGGACCTSSNADAVFAWASAGGTQPIGSGSRDGDEIKILFLPDQHLGRNTAAKAGLDVARHTTIFDPRVAKKGDPLGGSTPQQLRDAKVILWAGHCSVHKLFRPEHCDQIRAADAKDGTRTTILVHPECCKEVVDKADLAGSTEYIIQQVRNAPSGSRWAVGTEVHLVTRIAREAAARGVFVRILSDCQCLCTTMYRIDQPHLLWILDGLVGEGTKDNKPLTRNVIRVHPEVRRDALLALDRMLKHTGASTAKFTQAAGVE
ncbi:MAG: quinolinate synthase NadA [Planctomycetota bacterium]|nr:quinolinate synthase NadA [Planctomycetota bacterium]